MVTFSEERQILEQLNEWAKALRAKNVNKVLSHYTADAVLYDIAPPLKSIGIETLRNSLEQWFSTFQGPIGYEFGEIKITAGPELAFVQCLSHLTGKRTGGERTDGWMRVTVGFCNIDRRWLVSHEHSSVPLYMDGTNRAAIDLRP